MAKKKISIKKNQGTAPKQQPDKVPEQEAVPTPVMSTPSAAMPSSTSAKMPEFLITGILALLTAFVFLFIIFMLWSSNTELEKAIPQAVPVSMTLRPAGNGIC